MVTRLVLLAAVGAPVMAATGAEALAARNTPEVVIAANGRAELSIVVPEKPSPTEEFAARELQRYLAAITGARFEVSANPSAPAIVVCKRASAPPGITLPSAAANLPEEGYCLARQEGRLFLSGADDRGTLYAVYDLLERLGCRWLSPAFTYYQGASERINQTPRLGLVLEADVVEKPALKYRKLYVEEGLSHTTSNLLQMIDWMPRRRFNTLVVPLDYGGRGRVRWDNWREALTPELRRRGLCLEVGGHGYENYLNAKMEEGQLYARHPEWFHLDEQGRRVRNAAAVFCTSNREARNYLTRNVMNYLAAHPEIEIFDFWPPDGARWCHCAECAALGTPSDRQALLLQEVSAAVRRQLPQVRFETIAYSACVAPPLRERLDERVLVDFCPINQCFEVPIHDPGSVQNAAYVSQLKQWLGVFKGDISIYSYYRKYAWRSLPCLLPHYLRHDLRFYRDLGLRGISSYAEPGDWATYELNHYVLGGLAWNPDANVDEMVRQFAEARFGHKALLAGRAYALLEENVRRLCSLPGTSLKSPAEYERAATRFRSLDRELEAACGQEKDPSVAAALRRLGLGMDYVLRDLALQKARAGNGDVAQRRRMVGELTRFLQEHGDEGVFIADRLSAARQAARYGLDGP